MEIHPVVAAAEQAVRRLCQYSRAPHHIARALLRVEISPEVEYELLHRLSANDAQLWLDAGAAGAPTFRGINYYVVAPRRGEFPAPGWRVVEPPRLLTGEFIWSRR